MKKTLFSPLLFLLVSHLLLSCAATSMQIEFKDSVKILKDNEPLYSQSVERAQMLYYQLDFTTKRQAQKDKFFVQVSACSGQVSFVIGINYAPSIEKRDYTVTGTGELIITIPWKSNFNTYVGVYGNTSSSFSIEASSVDTPGITLPNNNITVAPVSNPETPGTYVSISWKPPTVDYAPFYQYQIYYAVKTDKASDGNDCNLFTECGMKACGKSFTDGFVTYKLETGETEYRESLQVPSTHKVQDLIFNIIVKDVFSLKTTVYYPYQVQQDGSLIKTIMIILLFLLPVLVFISVIVFIAVVVIIRRRRNSNGVNKEVYTVVY